MLPKEEFKREVERHLTCKETEAGEVVVSGHLKGNVSAKQRVQIKKNGSVNGDLTTAQIVIEDGAYFKGSIEIEKSGEKESNPHISSPTPQS